MKRFIFLAVFFILGALAFSAGLGERTYKDEVGERLHKEVTVDGKTLSKLVEVYSVIEYDSNGNLIHSKDNDGGEYWHEYDGNGNEIHFKENDGYEYWCEYDSKGNRIHYEDSSGNEEWYEYDSNGNQIHYKDSSGEEYWHEYTYWKNGKVKTKTEYHAL